MLPSSNTVLERVQEDRGKWQLDATVPNLLEHLHVYEKYGQVKELQLEDYLGFLWGWGDYEEKTGRVKVIN